jgi:hypothetical protein
MQLKIGENVDQGQEKVAQQGVQDGNWHKDRQEQRKYFEANFKYGSTMVLKHKGEFLFHGDISHCGTDNIFFNARKIKSMMEANGHTMGHMSYNDPPTFSSKWDWDRQEKDRKEIYKADLYKFVGDEIVVAEMIGAEPIGHIYDGPSGSGKIQFPPDCGSPGQRSPEISLGRKGNLPEVPK